MAFVTYILVVGYMLGLQDRFSPEVLAATASSALTALVLEILLIYLTTTIMSITSTLAKWDFLAFSMYKYVGMICCLLAGLLMSTSGYMPALLYTSAALALFLFRTLHLRVEPEVSWTEISVSHNIDISVTRFTVWRIMGRGSFGFCLSWLGGSPS